MPNIHLNKRHFVHQLRKLGDRLLHLAFGRSIAHPRVALHANTVDRRPGDFGGLEHCQRGVDFGFAAPLDVKVIVVELGGWIRLRGDFECPSDVVYAHGSVH